MLGTELGKLTGHLVATYAAFSSLKIPWDFHSFLMGFVSSSRTEGVKEDFTVTSLISLSLIFFFFFFLSFWKWLSLTCGIYTLVRACRLESPQKSSPVAAVVA